MGSELPVCPSCRHLVLEPPGTSRTICPHCGTLLKEPLAFDQELLTSQIRLPRVPDGRGRLGGSLARFFQSLRRRRHVSRTSSANSDDEDYNSRDVAYSRVDIRKSRSVNNLPPIERRTSSGNSEERSVTYSSDSNRFSTGQPVVKVRPFRPPSTSNGLPGEVLIRSSEDLKKAVCKAAKEENYDELIEFYTATFNSFQDMNVVFRKRVYTANNSANLKHCELDLAFVEQAYDNLMNLPTEIQKAVLKSVINCLLSDQRNTDVVLMRPVCRDDLRAYLVLLQNPQFRKTSTYVVFAHLLRQIATLCDQDHQLLAEWFAQLSSQQFSKVVGCIEQFISVRLFPPRPQDLPPLTKCSWWIPCSVKNLAILNAANDIGNLISFTDFYNDALDHWDLMSDFQQWQTPTVNAGFSFCQYPFILSINAKKTILDGHAEQQMIATARDSIIGNLAIRRTPDMDMLFLNIVVRRQYLLQDSLREISKKQDSLRKKLRVHFASEPGLDMGGLTKEWFQLLIRKIFHPDYGMFVYYPGTEVYWFSTLESEMEETLQEYHLVGVLMGLAVYNGVILDIRFPLSCYKKLLSPPVVPRILDVHSTPLGLINASLEDLAQIVPDVAHGLQELLSFDGDVEESFGLSFQVGLEEFGVARAVELKENGANIVVTNQNREEYVRLYVDWFLNQAAGKQFKAFYLGFHSVCSTNLLLLLRPEEIELLVCGSPVFNMEELKDVTTYDGFKTQDKTIRYFWDLVLRLPTRHQRRLLLFVTGTDRISAGGMKEMTFKISKMVSSNPTISPVEMLPMAHTCFNQLILPDYQDRQVLRQKLAIALAHGEGFGLE